MVPVGGAIARSRLSLILALSLTLPAATTAACARLDPAAAVPVWQAERELAWSGAARGQPCFGSRSLGTTLTLVTDSRRVSAFGDRHRQA